MTDDAKLREARAALLTMAQSLLAIIKHGDAAVIIAAADSLEAGIHSAECKRALECFEARTRGLN